MLILASRSAARKALLAGAGLKFESCPPAIDERELEKNAANPDFDPSATATMLALEKARAVARHNPGATVIGADQVLAIAGHRLHKPADLAGARQQLRQLRGRTHSLHAAIALVRDNEQLWSHAETARLTMRRFTDAELDTVLALEGDTILGSVGSYRLEGPSIRLFEDVEGDYFTILGLPLLPLLAALRRHASGELERFT